MTEEERHIAAGIQRTAGRAVHCSPSLSMFALAMLAGRQAGKRRPSTIVRLGFCCRLAQFVPHEPVA
jgi:hypothetical protein